MKGIPILVSYRFVYIRQTTESSFTQSTHPPFLRKNYRYPTESTSFTQSTHPPFLRNYYRYPTLEFRSMMSCAISPNYYRPLLPDSIRLLRLLPNEDENAPIQCQLFHYSLQESGKRTHPYDALSYVWGGPDKPRFISISEHNSTSGHDIPVTENLHEALTRLRHRSIERIIWVDAVCIDQANEREKEQQIQFMAKIYGQANCVVAWLGKAADDSDRALEEIRVAGGKKWEGSSHYETVREAVLALFQRPWFRRIWVWNRHLTTFAEITNRSI
jgi:heterokaryon incompatibility protein (HET)